MNVHHRMKRSSPMYMMKCSKIVKQEMDDGFAYNVLGVEATTRRLVMSCTMGRIETRPLRHDRGQTHNQNPSIYHVRCGTQQGRIEGGVEGR